MTLPIVQLTLQGMEKQIVAVLHEETAKLDTLVLEEIKRACSLENLTQVIHDAADRTIKEAIKSEIEAYYRFGNGRAAIAAAVAKKLAEEA